MKKSGKRTVGYIATDLISTFEVGKTYLIDNDKPLELHSNSGFHFCLKLEDVFKSHVPGICKIFGIETNSEVLSDNYSSITKGITIKRELTKEELSEYSFKDPHVAVYFDKLTDEELINKYKDKFDSHQIRYEIVQKIKKFRSNVSNL